MFTLTKRKEKWVEISVGTGASKECFDVLVRNPSYQEQTEAFLNDNRAAHHIQTAIVGWRGVFDPDGQAIVFSHDALQRLCEGCPSVFMQILRAASAAYIGMPSDEEKN